MEKMRLLAVGSMVLLLSVPLLWATKKFYHWRRERVLSTELRQEYLLMENSPVKALNIAKTINLHNQRQLAHVYHIADSVSGLALIDYENNFLEWLPEGEILPRDFRPRSPGDHLDWFRFDSLDDTYGSSELLVQYANPGTAGVHPFYLYSYHGEEFRLLLKLVEASNRIEIRNLDAEWPEELTHEFSISGIGKLERDLLRWKDIWRLEGGRPGKVNHQFPEEYRELIDLHQLALTKKEWEPDVKSYYPVLRCLKEKAELTVQGKLVDIEECRELLKRRYE